ncbi:hypothetical protein A2Z67_02300 [Candidatus Woesebacteria bacterium RBG_13_36_22]|uniref:LamG-like jellyroll fold domain-containing protein n=1 Tax=Candidatus Woesebacteria bacterium RBG_13_36_22 TaxID=1802478 RepID=A0A1F7X3C5_9BACT|nr:MAG: hypothetical protein A2Z67_02300 [Candidatus Woesebacteria bacterium RBG_13_36_22]
MGATLTGVLDSYSVSSNSLLTGLLGVWELNETSGLAQDELETYDAVSTDVTYDASGKIGRCFTYDGSDSVSCGSVLHLTSYLTVSCWMKTTNTGADWYALVGNYGSVNGFGYDITYYAASTRIEWGVRSTGHTTVYTAVDADLSNGNWHHIVCKWDGIARKIYIDGVDAGSADSWTYAPESSGDNLYIGDRGTCNAWIGSIDAVRIWERALTEDEIEELYAKENAGTGYPW